MAQSRKRRNWRSTYAGAASPYHSACRARSRYASGSYTVEAGARGFLRSSRTDISVETETTVSSDTRNCPPCDSNF